MPLEKEIPTDAQKKSSIPDGVVTKIVQAKNSPLSPHTLF